MRHAICAIVVVIAGAATALPQAASQSTTTVTMKLTEAVLPLDLSLRSSLTSGKDTAAVLAATEDDKTARIRIENPAGAAATWHLTLSGPIDKDSDRNNLVGLHGLEGRASIEGGLLWRISTPTVTLGNLATLRDGIEQLCRRAGVVADQVVGNARETCDVLDVRVTSDPRLAPELAKLIGVHGLTQLLSAQVSYSHDTFRFRDATSLAAGKETHPGYAAEVAYTFLPLYRNTLYSVSLKAQLENSYTQGRTVQLCTPLTGGATQCNNAILGAPTRGRGRAIAVESRLYVAGGVAIEPIARYDFSGHTTAVELPVYFLRNASGKLAGGITIGWDTGDRAVRAAVFVGSLLKAITAR